MVELSWSRPMRTAAQYRHPARTGKGEIQQALGAGPASRLAISHETACGAWIF
jgi:hypothetical protein